MKKSAEFVKSIDKTVLFFWVLLLPLLIAGCRGDTSQEPPVHLNQNMDFMYYYKPQSENPFFKDGRAMRPLVPGTVARGYLKADDVFYRGSQNGQPVRALPIPVNKSVLQFGQKLYKSNCTACHGQTGAGNGIVVQYGMTPPPNFYDDRILTMPVGEIFNVITHGIRTMPAYGTRVDEKGRWAIIAYLRTLQLTRNARFSDVPADLAATRGWKP